MRISQCTQLIAWRNPRLKLLLAHDSPVQFTHSVAYQPNGTRLTSPFKSTRRQSVRIMEDTCVLSVLWLKVRLSSKWSDYHFVKVAVYWITYEFLTKNCKYLTGILFIMLKIEMKLFRGTNIDVKHQWVQWDINKQTQFFLGSCCFFDKNLYVNVVLFSR